MEGYLRIQTTNSEYQNISAKFNSMQPVWFLCLKGINWHNIAVKLEEPQFYLSTKINFQLLHLEKLILIYSFWKKKIYLYIYIKHRLDALKKYYRVSKGYLL